MQTKHLAGNTQNWSAGQQQKLLMFRHQRNGNPGNINRTVEWQTEALCDKPEKKLRLPVLTWINY